MQGAIRPPAVAGTFYSDDPAQLRATVDALIGTPAPGPCPKALIVPHAGYVYSGAIAGAAFARLAPHAAHITRVILVGPAHRVFVPGLAAPGVEAMRTPLGDVAIDEAALAAVPQIAANPRAHAHEHSLEVELPFLQRVAPRARVVPIIGSRATAAEVGAVLMALWGGRETVIVVSSDLSHFHDYDRACAQDRGTAARIIAGATDLDGDDACGAIGVNGLLWAARRHGLRIEQVALANSGDTTGDRERVVGYGAFALYEAVW